ncbi:MAG: glycosyltransferase [Peptococcaceae bacterium MAG4]|nr:glycosyltransferase [Peptococcaceae bacterium MAG4]NLW39122.1 glycosyltransferase family 4 protein [Peptococcaceae bacterium]
MDSQSIISVVYGQYYANNGFSVRVSLIRRLLEMTIGSPGDWLIFDPNIDEEIVNNQKDYLEVGVPRTRSITNLLRNIYQLRWGNCPINFRKTYRLIFAHSFNSLFLAMALRKRWKLPIILDVHGLWLEEVIQRLCYVSGLKKDVLSAIERTLLKQVDGLIFVSQALRKYMIAKYPFLKNKTSVIIPCSVDTKKFKFDQQARSHIRQSFGWDNKIIIVHAGIIAPWVDIEGIIYLMNLCKQHIPAARFLFLSPDLKKLNALLSDHNLQSFAKVLEVKHNNMPSYLSAGDIGLICRIRSPINQVASPTKLAEYLAVGLPVLMTAGIGDYDEWVIANRLGIVTREMKEIQASDVGIFLKQLMDMERPLISNWANKHLDFSSFKDSFKSILAL